VLTCGAVVQESCAEESWVWLFVLLAVVIPTGLGFVMGLVKTGLNMANLKKRFGWEIPAALLSFPGPVLYVVLGILGILLWANMTDACDTTYSGSYLLLYVVFKIQVSSTGALVLLSRSPISAQLCPSVSPLRETGSGMILLALSHLHGKG
jgi:tryptophan-rich sensory protein